MRYGYQNFKIPSELSLKYLVYALPKLNTNTMTCETYLRGYQIRLNFASGISKRSNDEL